MKKTILTTSILASLLFFNCSKEDTPEENNIIEVPESTAEETIIEVGTLEDGISIEGATIQNGTISPNEETSFSVSKSEQSGFQDVGFEIELNVPENYAGAYLQLLSEDGTPSENYYDIPNATYSSKNLSTNTPSRFFAIKSSSLSAKTLEDEVETIEVDFDNTVPAGSFCYYLCIYDTDGNISAPQTLCVEVEEWGGNDNLVGSWNLTKLTTTEFGDTYNPVSYTHLTLPTIYSV